MNPYTFEFDPANADELKKELLLEVGPTHPLKYVDTEILAKRSYDKEILCELDGGGFVIVHLTWIGKQERDGFPGFAFYETLEDALND